MKDRGTINFRHLYQFWIVAHEGSLVGAGRRLGLSHSTISAQLHALEAQLGGPLLLRQPRGVRLTPLGETVQAFFRLGAELQEAAAASRGHGGRLVVGTVPRTLLLHVMRPGPVRAPTGPPAGDLRQPAGRLRGPHRRAPARGAARPHPHPGRGRPPASTVIAESRIALYGTRRLADRHRRGFPASLGGAPLLLPLGRRDGGDGWS